MNTHWHNKEEFRQIPNDDRFISCDGKVLSFRRGSAKILANAPDRDGYLKISRPEIKIHIAVLTVWREPKPFPMAQGRHLDGVKSNCHISNLAWGTSKENGMDKRNHGKAKGSGNPAVKMTEELVLRLRSEYASKPISVLVKENPPFSQFAIWAAVSGYTWSHLPGAIPRNRKCFKGS